VVTKAEVREMPLKCHNHAVYVLPIGGSIDVFCLRESHSNFVKHICASQTFLYLRK